MWVWLEGNMIWAGGHKKYFSFGQTKSRSSSGRQNCCSHSPTTTSAKNWYLETGGRVGRSLVVLKKLSESWHLRTIKNLENLLCTFYIKGAGQALFLCNFCVFFSGQLCQLCHLEICFLSTLCQMPQMITNIPRCLPKILTVPKFWYHLAHSFSSKNGPFDFERAFWEAKGALSLAKSPLKVKRDIFTWKWMR